MYEEEGDRLEAFVRGHWTGAGGIRGFCKAVGITPEALYKWFRGENYPSLEHLNEIARVLEVQRAEIIAAMDGYDLAGAQRDQIAREVEAAVGPLRQLLHDAGLLPAGGARDGAPLGVQR